MHLLILIFLFFTPYGSSLEENSFLTAAIQNNLEKIYDITYYVTDFLEDFNDRNLGKSEWGVMMGYDDIKPQLKTSRSSRSRKKMSMAMMPLLFHVGATSTWMLLTSILAAKSVAIGLVLLVFKIAVSAAKVASFFTLLKSKQGEHHEHAWTPHGKNRHRLYKTTKKIKRATVRSHFELGPFSDRSLNDIPTKAGWTSFTPEWSQGDPETGYITVPSFKDRRFYYEGDYEKIHADKKY